MLCMYPMVRVVFYEGSWSEGRVLTKNFDKRKRKKIKLNWNIIVVSYFEVPKWGIYCCN